MTNNTDKLLRETKILAFIDFAKMISIALLVVYVFMGLY